MATSPAPPEDTLRRLLDRAARSTLHRLAGNRNLIDGWALFGAPPAKQAAVEERCLEDRDLIGRLSWLMDCGLLASGGIEALLEGDRAAVLLHAALGLGAPEEARAAGLPDLDPRRALAAAAWVVLVGGAEPRWAAEDGCLVLRSSEPGAELPGWWRQLFDHLEGVRATTGGLELGVQPRTAARPS